MCHPPPQPQGCITAFDCSEQDLYVAYEGVDANLLLQQHLTQDEPPAVVVNTARPLSGICVVAGNVGGVVCAHGHEQVISRWSPQGGSVDVMRTKWPVHEVLWDSCMPQQALIRNRDPASPRQPQGFAVVDLQTGVETFALDVTAPHHCCAASILDPHVLVLGIGALGYGGAQAPRNCSCRLVDLRQSTDALQFKTGHEGLLRVQRAPGSRYAVATSHLHCKHIECWDVRSYSPSTPDRACPYYPCRTSGQTRGHREMHRVNGVGLCKLRPSW